MCMVLSKWNITTISVGCKSGKQLMNQHTNYCSYDQFDGHPSIVPNTHTHFLPFAFAHKWWKEDVQDFKVCWMSQIGRQIWSRPCFWLIQQLSCCHVGKYNTIHGPDPMLWAYCVNCWYFQVGPSNDAVIFRRQSRPQPSRTGILPGVMIPTYVWANYCDLRRGHLKWWFSKSGNFPKSP